MLNKITKIICLQGVISIFTAALFLQGCAVLPGADEQEEAVAPLPVLTNQPYHPKEFRELLIPNGLVFDREASMFVKTNSFKGGILTFRGRLEVDSLNDFFETSMQKEGWKFAGSVKSEKSLLIFTKPGKSCMITIQENTFSINTDVYIHITEQNTETGGSFSESFSSEEIIN